MMPLRNSLPDPSSFWLQSPALSLPQGSGAGFSSQGLAVEAGPGPWAKHSRLLWDPEGRESQRTPGWEQLPRAQGWSRTRTRMSICSGRTSSSSPVERNCCRFELGWRKLGLGRQLGLISK